MHADFLSRFTTHLKEVLQKALQFTIQQGRILVEPGDVLVALLQEKGSIGSEILQKNHVTLELALRQFEGVSAPRDAGSVIAPDLSPAVKHLLEFCVLTAHLHEHRYVGTEHLVFALIENDLPDVKAFFQACGLQVPHVREQVVSIFKSTTKFPDIGQSPPQQEHASSHDEEMTDAMHGMLDPQMGKAPKKGKALELFARELTASEHVERLDPVIGRDAETERVIEILCRRTKNNPILLGDPGVGKTAIVEGLAQRLVRGAVPDVLQGKRIFAVDLALMVAGTMYRGEFESRIKQMVEEAKADSNIVLFIDEIHTIVGAGSTSGSLDAANILKPALARGEIRCIGATTWNEYKKHIETDAALERRYQVVDVAEPTADLVLTMLRGIKQRYEDHHSVHFVPGTVELAVRLAERYLPDRYFPDKAVDVLDEAAAHVSTRRKPDDAMERLRALEVALAALRDQKEQAVKKGSLKKAAKLLEDEQRLLKEKKRLEQRIEKHRKSRRLTVEPEHIALVVARQSHVDVSTLLATDRERLQGLENRLNEIIFGQAQAVRAVAETVQRARLGLGDPKRPKGSLLFVGPSGTGKTELGRALALELFGREEAMVKLDMSEFAESHSVSKLLGSPAGYVGYREPNRLADTIRKHPHAVIVFDEFEKAHADVQHLLLQALEDGWMTDATGRRITLRHSYIILTSNVGAEFVQRTTIGFGGLSSKQTHFEEQMKEQLKERFRPELLNRLDRVVVFAPLPREAMKKIIERELHAVLMRLKESQRIAYSVTSDVVDWLLEQEMKAEEGARAARRLVEREILATLGNALLQKPSKKSWKISVKDKTLHIA